MKLGHWTNGISCEYAMQRKMNEWLKERELEYIDEFYVTEISRRPDFLVIKGGQLINIEAKCNNHDEMIRQLKDNAHYCNYSFAYIPDYCMTSMYFKRVLQSSGYGLFVFNYGKKVVTQVLEAHHNEAHDKALKKIIIDRIRKELILRKKSKDIDTQQPLNF